MRVAKSFARYLLGSALMFAGIGHFTFARQEFQAQVPSWLPLDADFVVLASGAAEIALGLGLLFLARYQQQVGLIAALFFIAVFPGNISQYLTQSDAFGLNSDTARAVRLLFQPLLVAWAIWSTDALKLIKRPG